MRGGGRTGSCDLFGRAKIPIDGEPKHAWVTHFYALLKRLVFGDSAMAVAAVDRLVHHAHIIDIQGESYRKAASLNKEETMTS